ncbi:MAG: flagellar filament capping protein FliD [Sandaracinaceae bacterium]
MVASITFSGLATGLDTASIIDSLLAVERQPITRIQQQKSAYASQADKLKSLSTKLTALKDAAAKLSERDGVLATAPSSSDESVLTAKAVGTAALGSTSIVVTGLASAQKTYSDGFASRDGEGLFGSGSLSIQVGSDAAIPIPIAATDTLDDVVSKIASSGADVTAGVVFDGTQYRLRVTGNQTGADQAITFVETGTTLGLDDPGNVKQAAADAVFTVDEIPMTRSTNTVVDAIPGVSLSLTSLGEANLSVARDTATTPEAVQEFVDAYDKVMNAINAEFAYTGVAKGAGSLAGDSTLRGLQTALRSAVGSVVSGTSGAYTTLASIGMKTLNDGTLQLDTTKLEAALAASPDAVADLFAGDGGGIAGFVTGFDDLLERYTSSTDGILHDRIDSLEGRQRGLDKQIDRLELRLGSTEERLRKQFATLEQVISGLNNQGSQIVAALNGLSNQSG